MANSPTSGIGNGSQPAALVDKDALRRDAPHVIDEAKSVAEKVTTDATEAAAGVVDQARAQIDEGIERAKSVAGQQKDLLAEQIGAVAGAIDQAASDLEGKNAPTAQYARVVAESADRLTALVRDNDVDQILAKAQDFGRRQPAAFLGAAALLGFAASRFVTASAERQQGAQDAVRTPLATSATGDSSSASNVGGSGSGGYQPGRV